MRKLVCSLALFGAVATVVAVAPAVVAQPKDKKDDKKVVKTDDGAIEVYQGKDGWRFRVLGPDGKSVAVGVQGYAKKEECLAAVEVLKATMAKAKVTELKDEKKEAKKDTKKDDKK